MRDSGTELVLAYWPGIRSQVPTTWIEWLRTGDESIRRQAIPNLAAGRWHLDNWTPIRWYVNFEPPYRRTTIGIDTFDLLLDLDDIGRHADRGYLSGCWWSNGAATQRLPGPERVPLTNSSTRRRSILTAVVDGAYRPWY
jgi:hypothetical protein